MMMMQERRGWSIGESNRASVERKLAAILAADVVGFSRMIGVDEAGVLEMMRVLRREIVEPLVAAHGGRMFKVMGDGMLAEFPSAVWAVRAAIDIQESLSAHDAAGSPGRCLELRLAVHQGDVVVENGDLLGHAVNVASRLETLATPGGICLSARVYEDAAGNIELDVEDIGEQELKNMARPVRVYRIHRRRVMVSRRAATEIGLAACSAL
jgi:class 3 adenylate cyclase